MAKRCNKCLDVKDMSEFYAQRSGDGRQNKCKVCVRAAVTANRLANLDHYVDFDAARANDPHRVAARKAYIGTDRGKAAKARASAAYNARNPEKVRAKNAVNNAVRDGRLVKKPCKFCGSFRSQAHHDYSKPLDVVWLCAREHKAYHRFHGFKVKVAA